MRNNAPAFCTAGSICVRRGEDTQGGVETIRHPAPNNLGQDLGKTQTVVIMLTMVPDGDSIPYVNSIKAMVLLPPIAGDNRSV